MPYITRYVDLLWYNQYMKNETISILDKKNRSILLSIMYLLGESIYSLAALDKIYSLHLTGSKKELSEDMTLILATATRDYFCVRLANLFDSSSKHDKKNYSLEKFFSSENISKLKESHLVQKAISARNSNICHMGAEVVEWPNIEEILGSKDVLIKLLKEIQFEILSRENNTR